ncbi:MAG: DUF4910 domain-containing protein, partial [Candidatus Thorarchaeota archaeon]
SQHHRIQCSPGLHNSLQYLKAELESISDAEVKIYEYPADGKSAIGQWDNLFGWFPKSAFLELIEPESKMLADFGSEPISLAAHSTSADIEAEVVYVGRGLLTEDYEGKDIAGKIVLTTSRASQAQRAACIDRGAIGVLTFVPPSGIDELADLRRYEGIWPNPGEKEKTKFGFALTQADGVQIRKWLDEGKTVKVRAKVDAELKDGKHGVLSAVIPGKDPSKEVWLTAHVCHPHPGANDNASGNGALAEVFRTITSLLSRGKIEQLDYSLRFIWMPEWNGMIQFMHNQKDLLSKCKFVINADMVGADPSKSGSVLHLFRTPYSLPSSLNNVLNYWLKTEAKRKHDFSKGGSLLPHNWIQDVYSAGSDHYLFTDATVKIPAIMLNQSPDKFYHTSTDTTDKIDPVQMAFVSRVITLSALTLCHPRHVCKEAILVLCRNEGAELIQKVGLDGSIILGRCLENPEKVYPRIMRWLTFAQQLGIATLDKTEEEWHLISEQLDLKQALKASIEMTYATEMAVARKSYLGACVEVGLEAKEQEHFDIDSYPSNLEIKRKLEYALPPSKLSGIDAKRFEKYIKLAEKYPYLSTVVDEMLNLCSDWKSLDEIVDRIGFQFGIKDSSLLEGIVDDLKDLGVVETKEM